MKRWIKWLVYFAGGGMLLFGLFIRVEHLRGERALKARLNALATTAEEAKSMMGTSNKK